MHEGQHEAIIDPDRWDRIQAQLQDGAAKGKARSTAKQRSLLCGKLFDETGDCLTPSHTKTRSGKRLRYYISHRLVTQSGEAQKDAWRLPAQELERKVAELVKEMIAAPGFAAKLMPVAAADRIGRAAKDFSDAAICGNPKPIFDLVARIDIGPGRLALRLNPRTIARIINADVDDLDENCLSNSIPFQHRKRGVETKIILADVSAVVDETLIRNIANAHVWFERIKAGETFTEIANTAAPSKCRIQQMIYLAFLAPDIIRDGMHGKQPVGFTSDWCLRHDMPSDWTEQRRLISTLKDQTPNTRIAKMPSSDIGAYPTLIDATVRSAPRHHPHNPRKTRDYVMRNLYRPLSKKWLAGVVGDL